MGFRLPTIDLLKGSEIGSKSQLVKGPHRPDLWETPPRRCALVETTAMRPTSPTLCLPARTAHRSLFPVPVVQQEERAHGLGGERGWIGWGGSRRGTVMSKLTANNHGSASQGGTWKRARRAEFIRQHVSPSSFPQTL